MSLILKDKTPGIKALLKLVNIKVAPNQETDFFFDPGRVFTHIVKIKTKIGDPPADTLITPDAAITKLLFDLSQSALYGSYGPDKFAMAEDLANRGKNYKSNKQYFINS